MSRFFIGLISNLPLKVLHLLGSFASLLLQKTNNRSKHIADTNLSICFPNHSSNKHRLLLNKSLKENSKTLLEAFWLWKHPKEALMSHLGDIKNEHLLIRAKESHKGTIFVTPHFGSWEFIGLLTAKYADLWILYAPPKSEYLERLSCEGRCSTGAKVVSTDNLNLKKVIQHLKNGGSIGILPDQVPDGHGGKYANFFGRKAYTSTLACKLASKLKCHLVLGYTLRNAINPSLYDSYYYDAPKDMFNEDIAKATESMNQCIEQYILTSPENYIWGYKRFKKPAPGDTDPYK
ncbi:MAG: lysophospholipid acyltransferase family protein [Pseudomonadota bacterium]